ncbi:uncharacterized protein LOC134280291 [Saccostrea cucullata]|uniref:uncharacterized protein LOC134257438 n=1 Tax=Saccostrea cuccullata TaxID=36930 RepID=UPI002ED10273
MNKHQEALIIAREEEVMRHGNVLYGLVKPLREGKELLLESSAAMVNVLPRKRIYRMGSSDELETFRAELLKRPLVVQPVVLAGSGFQSINCFFSVQREKWTVMINQTHPKILGRLLMGIDAAKRIMRRGEPFVLEFMFSDIVRRLYYDVVRGGTSSRYKYTDCEFGDLVIRYPGDFRHQGIKWEMKASRMRFSFDDITSSEIRIRDYEEANRETRDTRIIVLPRDELQVILPGWTFEEEIAEEKPYNYENYQICEEQNYAPIPAPRDTSREQTGRIRGRSNRNTNAKKYEVSVELHAPTSGDMTQETSFVSNDYRGVAASSEPRGPYSGNRFVHRYQGSGSGRSESSKADSGYEGEVDNGGFDIQRNARGKNSHPRKFYMPENTNSVPYDNPAFTHDHDNPAFARDYDIHPPYNGYPKGSDEGSHKYQTDRYNESYHNQRSPRNIVSHDHDVITGARQFQTIEQLDARMTLHQDYAISQSSVI